MTLSEIKQAIANGQTVHWSNDGYIVIKDSLNQYLIKFVSNNFCIGLTHQDGITLNGDESDFYIGI